MAFATLQSMPSGWDLVGQQLVGGFNPAHGFALAQTLPTNAGAAAVLAAAQARLLQASGQMPAASGAGGQYDQLNARSQAHQQKLSAYDLQLKLVVQQNAASSIAKLELALAQVYKLAVYIRGDYDGREDDEAQKSAIFAQCTQAFRDCQSAAEGGLKQLSDIHVQVTGLKDSEIGSLMRDIDAAIKQASMELENTKTLQQQNEQQMRQWEEQYRVTAYSLRRAQEEQDDLGNQISRGFSVFGSIFTDGLDGAAQKLAQQMADDRNRLNTAQQQMQNSQGYYMQAVQKRAELEQKYAALNQLQQQLPTLQSSTEALDRSATTLMGGFADLKEKASKLLMLINEMQNRAVVTMRQSYKKSMFAEGILKLCRTSLIDARVCDEVQMITTEIAAGYSGMTVPGDLAKLQSEVENLTKQILSLPASK